MKYEDEIKAWKSQGRPMLIGVGWLLGQIREIFIVGDFGRSGDVYGYLGVNNY